MYFRKLWQLYNQALHKRPLITKSCTSAVILSIGDFNAQYLEYQGTKKSNTINFHPNTSVEIFSYDYKRGFRFASYGLIIVGPCLSTFYKRLDLLIPGKTIKNSLTKVIIEQCTYSPFIVGAFFTYMNTFENKSIAEWKLKLKENYFPTLVKCWALWGTVNFFNFFNEIF